MSTIKFDLQLFGPGSGGGSWTEGITKSAVEATYNAFSNKIDAAIDAINNYSSVEGALESGWSGNDCQVYLKRFRTHAANVIAQIEEYRTAVRTTVDNIISQWEEFQSNLVS